MTGPTVAAGGARAVAGALVLLLALAAHPCAALELERTEIRFHGKSYEYVFAALIDGASTAVHAIVTDYDQLHRINDDIVESRLLERYDDGAVKRLLRLEHCLLVFCFDMRFVENVSEAPGRIVTTVVPAESNFLAGKSEWHIETVAPGRTRISVSAFQTPDFWIPPVIGPLLLRRVFLREVRETCANIERLARTVPADDA